MGQESDSSQLPCISYNPIPVKDVHDQLQMLKDSYVFPQTCLLCLSISNVFNHYSSKVGLDHFTTVATHFWMPLTFIMFFYARHRERTKKEGVYVSQSGICFSPSSSQTIAFYSCLWSAPRNHCPSKTNRGNKMRTLDGISYNQMKTRRKYVVKWGQVQLWIWELRRAFMEVFEQKISNNGKHADRWQWWKWERKKKNKTENEKVRYSVSKARTFYPSTVTWGVWEAASKAVRKVR